MMPDDKAQALAVTIEDLASDDARHIAHRKSIGMKPVWSIAIRAELRELAGVMSCVCGMPSEKPCRCLLRPAFELWKVCKHKAKCGSHADTYARACCACLCGESEGE
jgi:hypothetical protein